MSDSAHAKQQVQRCEVGQSRRWGRGGPKVVNRWCMIGGLEVQRCRDAVDEVQRCRCRVRWRDTGLLSRCKVQSSLVLGRCRGFILEVIVHSKVTMQMADAEVLQRY